VDPLISVVKLAFGQSRLEEMDGLIKKNKRMSVQEKGMRERNGPGRNDGRHCKVPFFPPPPPLPLLIVPTT